jgi:hypothetical protein
LKVDITIYAAVLCFKSTGIPSKIISIAVFPIANGFTSNGDWFFKYCVTVQTFVMNFNEQVVSAGVFKGKVVGSGFKGVFFKRFFIG